MNKFRALAQVVGFVTLGLLALYGLLALAGAAGPFGLEARADAEMPTAPADAAALLGGTMPQTMNYQGFLRDPDGSLTTGVYTITARVYELAGPSMGETVFYTTTVHNVAVRDGLFNIVLGDDPSLTPAAFSDAPRYIGIDLNDGAGELIPRQRLHAVPWALTASTLVDDATVNGLTVNGPLSTGNVTVNGLVGNVRLSSYTGNVQYDSPHETQPLSDYKLVAYDDFETDNDGWWPEVPRTRLSLDGSTRTWVLGPVAGKTWNGLVSSSLSLVKDFDLSEVPHSEVLFRLRYFAFDSWDGESAWVLCGVPRAPGVYYAGGASIWEKEIGFNDPGRFDYGGTDNSYEDGAYMAEVRCDIPPGVGHISLYVGATLDGPVEDESLAIDDVEVWVR